MSTRAAEILRFPIAGTNGSPREEATVLSREPRRIEASRSLVLPGHIPDSVWNPVADEVIHFLDNEIQNAEMERADFVRKIARWKLAYKAELPDTPKDFPFFGASNVPVPVIKEFVNTIAAQIVQMTLTNRPFWVFKDLAAEWEPFIDELERFMDIAAERDLKLDETAVFWIIEAVKLGTSILEVGHEVDFKKSYRYTRDGKRVYPHNIIRHDGPITRNIPLQRFWIRFNETDIQEARWCAKEIELTTRQLEERERMGKFYGIKDVLGYDTEITDEVTDIQERTEKTEPRMREKHRLLEVWLDFDIDRDGTDESIRLYWHRDARKVIGRHYHPYWHGMKPFRKLVYFPVEHRFYGEGLCEMLESSQAEITGIRNRRADNASWANLKLIIKRKMFKGLMPGDKLYSGKIIEANDIWNDVREFALSDIYPSTVTEEQIARQYAERISGASEANLGSAMPVTRTTAAAQLALLQEQLKRIDLTVRSMRKGIKDVGLQAMFLYNQYGVNGKAVAWMGNKGRIVEAIFRLPNRVFELGLGLDANAPSSALNRQVKRESSLALFNLLVQMYEKILPLAQAFAPEALPQVAREVVAGAKKFMGDTLESFEETDPEAILAGLTLLERVLPAAEDFGGLDSFRRAAETTEIIDKLSRLEDLARQAEAAAGRREGVRSGGNGVQRLPPTQGLPGGSGSFPVFGGDALLGRRSGPPRGNG